MSRVKDAEKSNDVAAIKSAVEGLEQATHALSKHMYETAQASAGGPAGAGAAGPTGGAAAPADDNVIDAEFEESN